MESLLNSLGESLVLNPNQLIELSKIQELPFPKREALLTLLINQTRKLINALDRDQIY